MNRLTPAGPQKTKARVWWLVHKDAKEGVDYTLDRLLPIWQRTSEQVRDEPTFFAHEEAS